METRRRLAGFGVLATIAALVPTSAHADFMNRVLLTAPGTIGAFTGQEHFTATSITLNRSLDVTVDYAVFGPGSFASAGGVFAPFSGFSVPPATNYVYAYQIFNNGPANGGISSSVLSRLGVNSLGAPITSLGKDTNFRDPGDVNDINTNIAFLNPQGATYVFVAPQVGIDRYSVVLLLASPYAPAFSQASVLDTGLSANGFLPIPVPAPGAALLGLMGLALVRYARRQA